jgi:hypothetical protein
MTAVRLLIAWNHSRPQKEIKRRISITAGPITPRKMTSIILLYSKHLDASGTAAERLPKKLLSLKNDSKVDNSHAYNSTMMPLFSP